MTARALGAGLLIGALTLLLAACGGSEPDAYGRAEARSLDGRSVTIDMRDLQFEPQGIRVRLGTTVTWINQDPVNHNVRQIQSVFLSPDVMEPGVSFRFTFEEPGEYRYQCTFHHPTMNGIVIVEPE